MTVKFGYQMTEVGLIPEDWRVFPLIDRSLRITDGEHITPRRSSSGYYLLSARNILNGRIDLSDVDYVDEDEYRRIRQRCNPETGDVLISCSGTVGRIAVVPQGLECVMVRSAALVKPDSATLSGTFAQYFLQSAAGQTQIIASLNQGAQANLFLNHIQKLRVPLPPTKTEQEAIAEALSDADAFIESLGQLLAKKRNLKQGAMQELLTGKRRLPGFAIKPGYKQTEVGLIPEDWELRPLLSTVRISNGQVDPRVEPYCSMILLAPDHIESASGRLLKTETATAQRAISGKYLFSCGDIVYGKINPYLKKAILADFDGICSADMYPLKPAANVSAGFIFQAILGHHFSKYAESVSNRSGIPKINRSELSEYVMALPSTKDEQEAIATVLSDMDAENEALQTKIAKFRQLKQGMMQELLTGRIRLV